MRRLRIAVVVVLALVVISTSASDVQPAPIDQRGNAERPLVDRSVERPSDPVDRSLLARAVLPATVPPVVSTNTTTPQSILSDATQAATSKYTASTTIARATTIAPPLPSNTTTIPAITTISTAAPPPPPTTTAPTTTTPKSPPPTSSTAKSTSTALSVDAASSNTTADAEAPPPLISEAAATSDAVDNLSSSVVVPTTEQPLPSPSSANGTIRQAKSMLPPRPAVTLKIKESTTDDVVANPSVVAELLGLRGVLPVVVTPKALLESTTVAEPEVTTKQAEVTAEPELRIEPTPSVVATTHAPEPDPNKSLHAPAIAPTKSSAIESSKSIESTVSTPIVTVQMTRGVRTTKTIPLATKAVPPVPIVEATSTVASTFTMGGTNVAASVEPTTMSPTATQQVLTTSLPTVASTTLPTPDAVGTFTEVIVAQTSATATFTPTLESPIAVEATFTPTVLEPTTLSVIETTTSSDSIVVQTSTSTDPPSFVVHMTTSTEPPSFVVEPTIVLPTSVVVSETLAQQQQQPSVTFVVEPTINNKSPIAQQRTLSEMTSTPIVIEPTTSQDKSSTPQAQRETRLLVHSTLTAGNGDYSNDPYYQFYPPAAPSPPPAYPAFYPPPPNNGQQWPQQPVPVYQTASGQPLVATSSLVQPPPGWPSEQQPSGAYQQQPQPFPNTPPANFYWPTSSVAQQQVPPPSAAFSDAQPPTAAFTDSQPNPLVAGGLSDLQPSGGGLSDFRPGTPELAPPEFIRPPPEIPPAETEVPASTTEPPLTTAQTSAPAVFSTSTEQLPFASEWPLFFDHSTSTEQTPTTTTTESLLMQKNLADLKAAELDGVVTLVFDHTQQRQRLDRGELVVRLAEFILGQILWDRNASEISEKCKFVVIDRAEPPMIAMPSVAPPPQLVRRRQRRALSATGALSPDAVPVDEMLQQEEHFRLAFFISIDPTIWEADVNETADFVLPSTQLLAIIRQFRHHFPDRIGLKLLKSYVGYIEEPIAPPPTTTTTTTTQQPSTTPLLFQSEEAQPTRVVHVQASVPSESPDPAAIVTTTARPPTVTVPPTETTEPCSTSNLPTIHLANRALDVPLSGSGGGSKGWFLSEKFFAKYQALFITALVLAALLVIFLITMAFLGLCPPVPMSSHSRGHSAQSSSDGDTSVRIRRRRGSWDAVDRHGKPLPHGVENPIPDEIILKDEPSSARTNNNGSPYAKLIGAGLARQLAAAERGGTLPAMEEIRSSTVRTDDQWLTPTSRPSTSTTSSSSDDGGGCGSSSLHPSPKSPKSHVEQKQTSASVHQKDSHSSGIGSGHCSSGDDDRDSLEDTRL